MGIAIVHAFGFPHALYEPIKTRHIVSYRPSLITAQARDARLPACFP